MKKFSEMTYKRPDIDALKKLLSEYPSKIRQAEDYPSIRSLFLSLEEESNHLSTMDTIASIRNSVNTADTFYEAEAEYLGSMIPVIELLKSDISKEFLNSPFLPQLKEEFGDLHFKNLANSIRLTCEKNVDLKIQENKLVQRYVKVSAVCKIPFHGEDLNFYGLLKHMQSTDRSIRKEAFDAWSSLYESISGELDEIYSSLVTLRCQMAENLGFHDYVEMSYLENQRYDYTREDTARFREQVRDIIVPICTDMAEKQKKRLGIDSYRFYDEALFFPEGNAVPKGNTKEKLSHAASMYSELSPETNEFFRFMLNYDLFDLETKPGKQQGGYCTFLPDDKAPFIFSNFNGTSADVDVLTHEAGHAFECYTASRRFPLSSQVWSTSEICEIHSMAMEFFTHPWMELFFGDQADHYRYLHVADSLRSIAYIACVDDFQHHVYEEKLTDPKKRREVWHQLEKIYLPTRDYDGNSFLEEGGFWMQKQHIFMYPFYYIEYALAQLGAFEYFGRMLEDPKQAWADYYRLCCAGGSKGYMELLKIGNLSNPFEPGAVTRILASIESALTL